jgi:hypothetical protein
MTEARARGSDPETSHEAARSLSPGTVTRMGKIVMWLISRNGENGRTWRELEVDWNALLKKKGVPDDDVLRQSISPRRVELRDQGMVEFRYKADGTMLKRINPKSRRMQGIWFLTPLGKEMLTAWLAVWRAGKKT